ncbi:MAG: HAD-IA family hydrolase [Spirochaetota bacterium]|nr:MAG: HAD-IA family hydrolase [Spirochaetota bacterium]
MAFDLYIFDLDGTLIDTRQDITTAVNEILHHYNLESKSVDEVTDYVGDGIRKLVQRCIEQSSIEQSSIVNSRVSLDEAVSMFKDSYWSHMHDTTITYPGITELLTHLKDKKKAILTNKAYKFTKAIMDRLGLTKQFSLIVGGDTVSKKKPSTEGIEFILQETGKPRDRTVMIGDGKNDILVAKKAGLISVYVTYGFTSIERLDGIKPDYIIDTPLELMEIG